MTQRINDMEIKEEILDDMIEKAKDVNAILYTVPVAEYKGWRVRVCIERGEGTKMKGIRYE
jgi:hypothetical protein